MKKYLLTLAACAALSASAQIANLHPIPQKVEADGTRMDVPQDLADVLDGKKAKKSKTKIIIGQRGDKSVKKYLGHLPQSAEGYWLSVTPQQIVLVGTDARGLQYGKQTLRQMIDGNQIEVATITDYPDVLFRGVVEGFYGQPWSHQARLAQLDFYGQNRLNTYIYGPKDDPYHSTPHWRDPYPEKEAAQIKALVQRAHQRGVDFVWAIHPGKDIQWNDADRDKLMAKFQSMYDLGVRSFAVFFDDISGIGTDPNRQAELLNYLDDHFVKVKGDVTPLIMCPTEYNKSWSNVAGGYLTTLGDKLNPTVEIMWTGDRVIACIDRPTMDWINPLLKRKAYIWFNFPVSDYVRDHLLMGPTYGNGLDIKDQLSGFVSNPMERAEASKVSLYSIADYTWNMQQYDSIASWKQAMKAIMPRHAADFELFCENSQDLGPNGHGFRRTESTRLTPIVLCADEEMRGSKSLKATAGSDYFMVLSKEMAALGGASESLLKGDEAPELIAEIAPWLQQSLNLSHYGVAVCNMALTPDSTMYCYYYREAKRALKAMHDLDATENQNPYQPGVKIGSRVLLPALNEIFARSVKLANQELGMHLDANSTYVPVGLESDVPQLAAQPIQFRGGDTKVSPSNEVIKWPAQATFMLTFDKAMALTDLKVDLGVAGEPGNAIVVEVRLPDGQWHPATLKLGSGTLHTAANVSETTALRLRNVTQHEQQVYLRALQMKIK